MSRHFSLLLAEPDQDSREQLGAALGKDGYCVIPASTGTEAVRIAREQAIHGAVVSMQLPDLSGIETLRRMQGIEASIPSILISSEPWKELQLEALDLGVFSFIQKPVADEILRTTVAKLMDRRWPEGSFRFSIEIYRGPRPKNS